MLSLKTTMDYFKKNEVVFFPVYQFPCNIDCPSISFFPLGKRSTDREKTFFAVGNNREERDGFSLAKTLDLNDRTKKTVENRLARLEEACRTFCENHFDFIVVNESSTGS
nr:hypothetical protein [Trentepohlia sp. YN1317]